MNPVSATTAAVAQPHLSVNRPNPVAVGTIVWLASELMFFAGLFAMYFTTRANTPELWAQETPKLNLAFAAINTTILVLSSVTCQMGVWAAERFQPTRTGFHGLHVIGGLLAFLFLLGRSFAAKRFGHHEATTAIVVSYYWHFVDVVWIALFGAIYLIR